MFLFLQRIQFVERCGNVEVDGKLNGWAKNTNCILKPEAEKIVADVQEFGRTLEPSIMETAAKVEHFANVFKPHVDETIHNIKDFGKNSTQHLNQLATIVGLMFDDK